MLLALGAHDEVLPLSVESTAADLFNAHGDGVCEGVLSRQVRCDAALAAQRALECRAMGLAPSRRAARGTLRCCASKPCAARDGRRHGVRSCSTDSDRRFAQGSGPS